MLETQRLTDKQENFTQAIFTGSTQVDAYRSAYDCSNWSDNAIYVEASRMLDNPKISLRLAELRAPVEAALVAETIWTRKKFLAEAEINLHQSRELKQMAPANGSLQMIGKVTGILVDKVEHSGEISHAHNVIHGLSDDMLDRLAGLVTPEFGDTVPETRGIIEHEPTNVSPEEV